jgi:phage terminase small subunit
VHELQEGNLLDSADRGMIELAAVQADILAQCNAALAESLTITVTRGTYRGEGGYTTEETSPFFKMRQDAAKELRQLYGELGIGPGARASLANSGSKAGKKPAQVLPGVGNAPTPLRAVND